MLPSFYRSQDKAGAWSIPRAAAYGAGIGALAALLKVWLPLHGAVAAGASAGSGKFVEVLAAAIVFALLCAAAACLRNALARRLAERI